MPTCLACANCREEYKCPACGFTGMEIAKARREAKANGSNTQSGKG